MADANVLESDYLTRKEASDYLRRKWRQRVSPGLLGNLASRSKGPPYHVIPGSGVFYKRDKLDKWAAGRMLPGKVAAV